MAQIDDLHARVGRADSLAEYLRGLATIGVVRFDSFVSDGHSEFLGADGYRLVSTTQHEVLPVAEVSNRGGCLEVLCLQRLSASSTAAPAARVSLTACEGRHVVRGLLIGYARVWSRSRTSPLNATGSPNLLETLSASTSITA